MQPQKAHSRTETHPHKPHSPSPLHPDNPTPHPAKEYVDKHVEKRKPQQTPNTPHPQHKPSA